MTKICKYRYQHRCREKKKAWERLRGAKREAPPCCRKKEGKYPEEEGEDKRGSKRVLDQKHQFTCWSQRTARESTSKVSASSEARHEGDPKRCLVCGKEKRKVDHRGPYWGLYSQSSNQEWSGKASRQEYWCPQAEAQEWQCNCPAGR